MLKYLGLPLYFVHVLKKNPFYLETYNKFTLYTLKKLILPF